MDGSPRLRWERVDRGRFERARAILLRYRDKDFSFTDCTSFAIMRELRLSQALTTDRHFRQMGFLMLPDVRLPRARRTKSRSASRPTRRR